MSTSTNAGFIGGSYATHMLTIKASSKEETTEGKADYYRSEISSGSFSRTLSLSCAVDIDKAKSSFREGILELTLPKLEKTHRRTIKVD